MNIRIKWTSDQRGCIVSPKNSGNQWVNAANMANTAPIDKT